MQSTEPAHGTVHALSEAVKKSLFVNPDVPAMWRSLTPLTRNEWICRSISVKQQKTRDAHVKRLVKSLEKDPAGPAAGSAVFTERTRQSVLGASDSQFQRNNRDGSQKQQTTSCGYSMTF
ncbi:MAG: YdeI/OmpD-associated family protein [Firmicutes bacterium]|jgi:hypothetical protein|nr:YdeI/OmpD-associated family protein [Bacillota bacterium]